MADLLEKESNNNSKQGKVNISKEAFRNMITHVLRFGNVTLENSLEVMGVCLGMFESNGKDMVVVNAIPINHGQRISNGFIQEDHNTFKKIEEHYISQNLQIIGWYLSHPGWGLFFSDIAIKNQRFFQTEQKPYSFCIVFDHTLMGKEGNLGFEIYRLDDYKDSMNKNFHRVLSEVEIPKSLDYFKWTQKFVEDIQKKNPILIKEYNELIETVPRDLQKIPMQEMNKEHLETKEIDQKFKPLISGFQEGSSKLNDIFDSIFEDHMKNWSYYIKEGSIKGSDLIQKSVAQMKEKIMSGMINIENWFDRNINEIINGFKEQFHYCINERIESQKVLVKQISNMKENINNNYNKNFNENFNKIISEMDNKKESLLNNLNNTKLQSSNVGQLIDSSSQKISKISEDTDNIIKNIKNNIEQNTMKFEHTILNEIKKLSVELTKLKDSHSKLNNSIQKLQKISNNLKDL